MELSELWPLEKNLAWRNYKVQVKELKDSTILILTRDNNILDCFAFKDVENCGFRFTEVTHERGVVRAIFHRRNENKFLDLA
jgi:hypothetical protein